MLENVFGTELAFQMISTCSKSTIQTLNPFQPRVSFHIETSHLFCRPKQMTAFYVKRNTGLKWVNVQNMFKVSDKEIKTNSTDVTLISSLVTLSIYLSARFKSTSQQKFQVQRMLTSFGMIESIFSYSFSSDETSDSSNSSLPQPSSSEIVT